MILDLIGAIGLTGAAALWVAVLSRWYGTQSPRLIYWHAGWFVAVATIGATGVLQAIGPLGTPALGLMVAAPMIACTTARSASAVRSRWCHAPSRPPRRPARTACTPPSRPSCSTPRSAADHHPGVPSPAGGGRLGGWPPLTDDEGTGR